MQVWNAKLNEILGTLATGPGPTGDPDPLGPGPAWSQTHWSQGPLGSWHTWAWALSGPGLLRPGHTGDKAQSASWQVWTHSLQNSVIHASNSNLFHISINLAYPLDMCMYTCRVVSHLSRHPETMTGNHKYMSMYIHMCRAPWVNTCTFIYRGRDMERETDKCHTNGMKSWKRDAVTVALPQ
jgi:hypothetical protein